MWLTQNKYETSDKFDHSLMKKAIVCFYRLSSHILLMEMTSITQPFYYIMFPHSVYEDTVKCIYIRKVNRTYTLNCYEILSNYHIMVH